MLSSSSRHCFYPVSPAPGSTHFSFSYLPFIDPSTYYCPDIDKGYNRFGGLQSDSETQNEVSSFSTFPTSLFALKPSRQGPAGLAGLNEKSSSSNPDKEKASPDSEKEPDKVTVPPTHLSHVGLPVQIHVGNLKHLPKKDIPTPSTNEAPAPLPLPPSSSSSAPPLPNDTGSSSKEKSPPPLSWQSCTPSSSIFSLDKSLKRAGMFSRRHKALTTQMVADITGQLKAAFSVQPIPKPDPPPPPPLPPPPPVATAAALLSLQQQQQAPPPPHPPPPLSAPAGPVPPVVVSSSASTVPAPALSLPLVTNRTPVTLPSNSTLSPLPIQTNKLVSSLMLDQRTMETALAAREKALAPIVHHNSPNGSVHDLFNHAKLQAEAEKEIKHALAAG